MQRKVQNSLRSKWLQKKIELVISRMKKTRSTFCFVTRKRIVVIARSIFIPKIELFVSERFYFFPCLDINRYRQSVSAVCDPRAVLKHFYFLDDDENSRPFISESFNCPIFLAHCFTKSKHPDKYIACRATCNIIDQSIPFIIYSQH